MHRKGPEIGLDGLRESGLVAVAEQKFMNTWGWPYGVGDIGRVSAAQNARGRELYLVI